MNVARYHTNKTMHAQTNTVDLPKTLHNFDVGSRPRSKDYRVIGVRTYFASKNA